MILGNGSAPHRPEKLRPDPWHLLGTADPAALAARVLSSRRLGGRKKAALLLYLEGLPVRQCARFVGLGDHMGVWRAAGRYGLHVTHRERLAFKRALHMAAEAEAIAAQVRKGHAGAVQTLRGAILATDALEAIQRIDHRLL